MYAFARSVFEFERAPVFPLIMATSKPLTFDLRLMRVRSCEQPVQVSHKLYVGTISLTRPWNSVIISPAHLLHFAHVSNVPLETLGRCPNEGGVARGFKLANLCIPSTIVLCCKKYTIHAGG